MDIVNAYEKYYNTPGLIVPGSTTRGYCTRVVGLIEPSARRENIVGQLKPESNVGHYWTLLPADPRLTRMLVDSSQIPAALMTAHQDGKLGSMLVGKTLNPKPKP